MSASARVVVVSGAAGAIGGAAALKFAGSNAKLALFDRRLDLLDDVTAACGDRGAEVLPLAVDQTDRGAVEGAFDRIKEQFGAPTVLFANAGYGRFATFLETSIETWQRHVDVNLTGTFHVCQVAARHMADARSGGSIVINASSAAEQHADQLLAYGVTKAGLRMLAIGMASELGVHRIRVNVVMPGVIETSMTAPALANDDHRTVLLAETPVGRLGRPEDVANAVHFLASDDASFITGEELMIDGGQTIHAHPRWFRLDYSQAHVEKWEIPR